MTPADWPAVRDIYAEGIAGGNATFETVVPEWAQWDKGRLPVCRLAVRLDEQVVGWAALSPYSSREVYRGVADVGIYIAGAAQGRGVGKALLTALVEESEKQGFWTLQAGILIENVASRRLHQACGFREVGIREKIGQLHGVWRDVVLMERRSKTIQN